MKTTLNRVQQPLSDWIASIERGDCGFTYVRLYRDTPTWAKNAVVNRFGKGTVFLPPRQFKPVESAVA